ncbi:hypothetical protein [Pyruvatibacter sp.]
MLAKTIRAPIVHWRDHVAAYAILVVAPILVISILVPALGVSGAPAPPNPADLSGGFFFGAFILWAAYLICYLAFVVVVHRTVAGVERPWALTTSLGRYLITCLLVGLIVVAAMIPVGIVFGGTMATTAQGSNPITSLIVGQIVLPLLTLALITRFLLAFPAAALDKPTPIRRSLSITNDRFGPLYWGVVVTSVLIAVFFAVPGKLLTLLLTGCSMFPLDASEAMACAPDSLALHLLQMLNIIIGYFPAVIAVSFLTYSFLDLDAETPGKISGSPENHQDQ